MKKILTICIFIIATFTVHAQTIYSKAYGNPTHTPLIYFHGGPGYNSVSFEVTTAN